ncbi:hypothetical protein BLA50215_01967 [Burkholderia lata]|nr:hypothetical protein BLA50215_01967 [Burkholderia lata]
MLAGSIWLNDLRQRHHCNSLVHELSDALLETVSDSGSSLKPDWPSSRSSTPSSGCRNPNALHCRSSASTGSAISKQPIRSTYPSTPS